MNNSKHHNLYSYNEFVLRKLNNIAFLKKNKNRMNIFP